MKNIVIISILFALTFSACGTLNNLIPQSKKDKVVDQTVKALCENKTDVVAFLRGSKLDGAIDFATLCQ